MASMTPAEHYEEAGRLLSDLDPVGTDGRADQLAEAHVHAILATVDPSAVSAG